MKLSPLPLTRLVLGTVAGIGLFSSLLVQPTWAEPSAPSYNPNSDANPLQGLGPQDYGSDPFARMNRGDSMGLMDLMRRATQSGNRSIDDFNSEQNQSIDQAAAQFRARQQQQIQGKKQVYPK